MVVFSLVLIIWWTYFWSQLLLLFCWFCSVSKILAFHNVILQIKTSIYCLRNVANKLWKNSLLLKLDTTAQKRIPRQIVATSICHRSHLRESHVHHSKFKHQWANHYFIHGWAPLNHWQKPPPCHHVAFWHFVCH